MGEFLELHEWKVGAIIKQQDCIQQTQCISAFATKIQRLFMLWFIPFSFIVIINFLFLPKQSSFPFLLLLLFLVDWIGTAHIIYIYISSIDLSIYLSTYLGIQPSLCVYTHWYNNSSRKHFRLRWSPCPKGAASWTASCSWKVGCGHGSELGRWLLPHGWGLFIRSLGIVLFIALRVMIFCVLALWCIMLVINHHHCPFAMYGSPL